MAESYGERKVYRRIWSAPSLAEALRFAADEIDLLRLENEFFLDRVSVQEDVDPETNEREWIVQVYYETPGFAP